MSPMRIKPIAVANPDGSYSWKAEPASPPMPEVGTSIRRVWRCALCGRVAKITHPLVIEVETSWSTDTPFYDTASPAYGMNAATTITTTGGVPSIPGRPKYMTTVEYREDLIEVKGAMLPPDCWITIDPAAQTVKILCRRCAKDVEDAGGAVMTAEDAYKEALAAFERRMKEAGAKPVTFHIADDLALGDYAKSISIPRGMVTDDAFKAVNMLPVSKTPRLSLIGRSLLDTFRAIWTSSSHATEDEERLDKVIVPSGGSGEK